MPFEIHSVDFRSGYTTPQAKQWLAKHNLKPIKRVHITKEDGKVVSRRYRIQDPELFKNFITKKVDDGKINLILGSNDAQDGTGVISNIKDFVQGRPSDMYPPQIRKFIEVYGNHKVENVMVARKPVWKILEHLVNTFSGGDLFKKMKELNIDRLRHLYVVLKINGTDYTFEKDEVIKVAKYQARSGQETLQLGKPKNDVSVAELFASLIKQDPQINIYDSIKANCQGFVAHVLRVLGLWGPSETVQFVKQPTDKLLSPFVQKLNKGITTAGAKVNVLIEGKGKKKKCM